MFLEEFGEKEDAGGAGGGEGEGEVGGGIFVEFQAGVHPDIYPVRIYIFELAYYFFSLPFSSFSLCFYYIEDWASNYSGLHSPPFFYFKKISTNFIFIPALPVTPSLFINVVFPVSLPPTQINEKLSPSEIYFSKKKPS